MKIGIFDSGLGGLIVAQSLIKAMPQYNYLYLGDTKRVPYGNRSQEVIYEFTKEAVEYLFQNDCQLIILACNTASAEALRKIQQDYLPAHYPDRRVLGVIIPTAEDTVANLAKSKATVGVLATQSTVESGTYTKELLKLKANLRIVQQAAPLLVPIIENNERELADLILTKYLHPLLQCRPACIVLGCTHYSILKDEIRRYLGPEIKVIAQDEIMAKKLQDYLLRHPEFEVKLGRKSIYKYHVTDRIGNYNLLAKQLTGEKIDLELVNL